MAESSIEAEILRQGRRIDPLLEELVPRGGPAHLAEIAWYHLETGGKRIRPALCLVTCEVLGGDSERALHFAAAVELLHNMLLLHDDIEDGDTVRRNKPTVWKAYGVGNAVNVGDYLLGRSLRAVMLSPLDDQTRGRLLDVFVETYGRTVEGQALDINSRSAPRFTVEDYLRTAVLKTGYYLVLGMIGGAIIAGAPEVTLKCLRRLGENMGPAFQIRDDLIDLTSGKGRGGVKGSDVREGKASILYAHALAHSMPAEQERLLDIMRKPRQETTGADVEWVVQLYERCGSIPFARNTAEALIHKVQDVLGNLPMEQQSSLRDLVAYLAERMS